MILSLIVALAENNAIGIRGELPWHLPEDLKFFKRTTIGKPVFMGRKTYESLGRPLPGRLNIVLSSQKDFALPQGVLLYNDIPEAIERLQKEHNEEAFIIGGGQVFEDTLPYAQRMYLTRVHTSIPDADAFFPVIDLSQWKKVWHEDHTTDEKHKYSFTFEQWERIK
ncbi:MAG: dihydrofolate reductase [Bacteroidota bacterium]